MNTESLFPLWSRLGVNFPAFEPSKKEPLLEELIAQTSIIGRYEPRLIEAMAGWIDKHGELINTSQMHKKIASGDSAVLGLVFDILSSKESFKIKQLMKYCIAKPKEEMLFYTAETSPTMKAKAIENETEVNRRWNLYYVSLRIKTDAVFERKIILQNNPNLARRAIFGTGMRTEIINFLLDKGISFPAEIANALGYRYHRIFDDIQELIRDGIIIDSNSTSKKMLKISPAFENYLNLLPY
ncbi:MAG: hypothetical protein JW795_14340 [Chitinivibrionales bacterium]|nr:hypothetical protein [Chitinivibrionales bacterium]